MDMDFGIRIWIFTEATGGYPQLLKLSVLMSLSITIHFRRSTIKICM